MLISKSLFIDYMDFPKLAWWRVNDREIYNKIRKIESEEDKQHIIQLGQQVEDAVLEYLRLIDGREVVNLMPDFRQDAEIVGSDEDDDRIDDYVEKYSSDKTFCENTIKAIYDKKAILYQPTFQWWDCSVRADIMILQPNGKYRLIEVKAKSWVRKSVKDDGEDKKIGQLDKKFIYDLSFQKYVINHVLEKYNLPLIDGVFIAYLNKEYVKDGDLDYEKLIVMDQVDVLSEISVIQWKSKSEKRIQIDDRLMDDGQIQKIVNVMKEELVLDQEGFNEIHPFLGNKYTEYFANLNKNWDLEKPFGTIYSIPRLHSSKSWVVKDFHEKWVIDLLDLSEEDKNLFYNKDGMWAAGEFIELYCACMNQGENTHILSSNIKEKLSWLNYPICFYDYESVSVPIPFMDNTSPYQQVVVQYSLHKLYENGKIEHYGAVLWWLGESFVKNMDFENKNRVDKESDKVIYGSYKDLLVNMVEDIWDDINQSSFVVWNKWFENSRNKEVWKIFPELASAFEAINEGTFDLMEIFYKNEYFDIRFGWSASIKKVLPILVPDMNYSALEISNGGVAMKKLHELLLGSIVDEWEKEEILKNLLIYCGQDSLAMLRIYEKLKSVIPENRGLLTVAR